MSADLNCDLPLVSNVEDVLVTHYDFDFRCDFDSQRFVCSAVLFLKIVGSERCTCSSMQGSPFVLVLDCHQLEVERVEEFSGCPLSFSVSEWSLRVWRNGGCKHCFPPTVRVLYRTVPECPSLLWTPDQDGKPSVFSHGAFINNRALFPCQEPPVAMATWEAEVSVPETTVVLMSGDHQPRVTNEEGVSHYFYRSDKPLPLSTLSLAIGSWEGRVIQTHLERPTCRLFACPGMLEEAMKEFSAYIPLAVESSVELLGPYPFPRIDFLVVPPAFGSLGMANPNLVFLSQSLVLGGGGARLSHEVSHGWFGLSVGALDWTEEWLSEGFATFAEDVVHARATRMEDPQAFMELRALIRQKTLIDEVNNTSKDLQILRPSLGEVKEGIVDGMSAPILKNGQNPMKNFTQVHYIKGFFLLKHMSDCVGGVNPFVKFLRTYVQKYEGQLVTSREFLTLFYQTFPSFGDHLSMEELYEKWLHGSGLAKEIVDFKPHSDNKLYQEVLAETKKWKKVFSRKRSRKRFKFNVEDFIPLSSEQLVLVLEELLLEPRLGTLDRLQQVYRFGSCSAEVQHRWFELVVKHRHRSQYLELEKFLTDHLAMGVYLWGELIHSGDQLQKRTAEELRSRLSMEPSIRSTIDQMFRD